MKTSEFKQAVEALGFTVVKEDSNLVINGEGSLWLADVSLKYKYALRIYFGAIDEVGEEKTRKLFELLTAYASTPIVEREEPKKYYVKCPITGQYLHESIYYPSTKFTWRETITVSFEWKSQYTRAEIDAFEFEHAHLIEEEVSE
ncbi:hypothetical protein HB816_13780 [Listeria booriae]|uniref:hypothetical protein n=1 Tax=Listeria booriae TaxID=1552123 RepID=UPI00162A4544|nr:hypothetical protein [Listeria booriae]MBC1231520.1 hypothetical protein [Listeria booriae]